MAARVPSNAVETALSLTLAIVASSPGPLLLLDGDLNIVAASASFSRAFEVDARAAIGRPLSGLGAGEWDILQLRSLLNATVSDAVAIESNEIDFKWPGHGTRRLVVQAERLDYLDLDNVRLLVTVSDVTDARAEERLKDDANRRNLVLLQEVRHRVANGLQIIASLLLQNAKKTSSDEARGHLRDAHHRVKSIAALERQLVGSGDGVVELRAYFTTLCDSIAASMIGDSNQISLVVAGAMGVVDARVSVSLGLIVTELVINALKHAFPDGRHGTITVDCAFKGPNWTLSVSDDGVGMPDPAQIRTGLGSSIVQALAKQLGAAVEIERGNPGTRVAIVHIQIALVEDVEKPMGERTAARRPAA